MDEKYLNLQNKLSSHNALKSYGFSAITNYLCMEVNKGAINTVSKILKEEFGFKLLIDIVGVDRFTKENRFELIYNIYNTDDRIRLFVRIKLDSKEPMAESVTSIWTTADWQEREAFDMFGIKFNNHPDLRRIYLAEDFEYYPLRKDFPLMGIPGSMRLPNK